MRFYARKKRMPTIIIVSLIDIFAILLMFFIVTTTFKSTQSELTINLPESKQAREAANPANPLLLAITAEEKMQLDDRPIATLEELTAAIRDRDASRPLALRADKEASFGFILKVMDALKEAGIKNLPAFTQSQAK
ncbi:MAG TPA: biopolymer transporter ExbD [Chthoniobacterales bacterium]|jgi:biopolymer transport protein ExbD